MPANKLSGRCNYCRAKMRKCEVPPDSESFMEAKNDDDMNI